VLAVLCGYQDEDLRWVEDNIPTAAVTTDSAFPNMPMDTDEVTSPLSLFSSPPFLLPGHPRVSRLVPKCVGVGSEDDCKGCVSSASASASAAADAPLSL